MGSSEQFHLCAHDVQLPETATKQFQQNAAKSISITNKVACPIAILLQRHSFIKALEFKPWKEFCFLSEFQLATAYINLKSTANPLI